MYGASVRNTSAHQHFYFSLLAALATTEGRLPISGTRHVPAGGVPILAGCVELMSNSLDKQNG